MDETSLLEFFACARSGDVKGLKDSLALGCAVNETNQEGYGALHLAAKFNRVEAVRTLLEAGAAVDLITACDDVSKSALHIAAHRGHVEVMRLLLDAGADIELEGNTPNDTFRPLSRAALESQFEAMELLLARGANVNAKVGLSEVSALSHAAFSLMSRPVRFLLEHGADANVMDDSGVSPLMEAAIVGATPICELLVEIGNADLTHRNQAGATALDEAIRFEMWDTAHYLWSKGSESSIVRGKNGVKASTWVRPYFLDHITPRQRHGCTTLGDRVFCFGGRGIQGEDLFPYNPDTSSGQSGLEKTLSDLWSLDFTQCELLDLRKLPKQSKVLLPDEDTLKHEEETPTTTGKKMKAKKTSRRRHNRLEDQSANTIDEKTMHELMFFDGDDNRLTVARNDALQEELPDEDIACNARAVHPFCKSDKFCYFEATVLELATGGCVAVGIVTDDVTNDCLPGWEIASFGMHSDDARAFRNSAFGSVWGRRFDAGDTVGCGIMFETQEVFFTLNGNFLGVAFCRFTETQFFASIGIRARSSSISLNFGASHFMFDFLVPTLKWTQLPPCSAELPAPHQLLTYRDKLVVFRRPAEPYSLHLFDPETNVWIELAATNASTFHLGNTRSYDTFSTFIQIEDAFYGILIVTAAPARIIKVDQIDLEAKTCRWSLVLPAAVASSLISMEESALISDHLNKEFSESPIIARNDGQIWLFAPKLLGILDLATCRLEIHPTMGAHPVSNQISLTPMSNGHIAAFGGWDESMQRNDLLFFDPTRRLWYHAHRAGIAPRPRSFHASTPVTLPYDHLLLTHLANMRCSSSIRKPPVSVCVVSGGWSGHAHLSDIDILIPATTNRDLYDETTLPWTAPEDTPEDLVVTFKVTSPNGSLTATYRAYAIIVASRCSTLRGKLTLERVKEVEVSNAHPEQWKRLLQFFADDQVDFEYDHDEARTFYGLVERWCPEHAKRISEALLMDILYQPSNFASDLAFAFDCEHFSDVTVVVEGQKIRAHRCILGANLYFKHLFTSGMRDAATDFVEIATCGNLQLGRALLQFIYTRDIDLTGLEDDIMQLRALSDMYLVEDLTTQLDSLLIPAPLT